ncbi:uncharacterized protein LOC107410850 isoform X1 [Ziziphus jujuba]|uniref:Uncharacterized protein LOC107410850 isoform X1 n=1 Tax=Ziziphus jujuba TaxID=326968 RepID=A0ABM3IAD8_ZIZJJ|nr:uncharacterized protein LOC107410850 isoform X1 [Ziziphus jujuba]XP_048324317.2 uncharacterized protein LOC107410850 isoform X1 [Ziziphus jujuba]
MNDVQVLEDMRIPIYRNPEMPIEVRVKDLLPRMELKEKIGQMTQIERRVANPQILRDFCIGGMLSCTGSGPFKKASSGDWAEMVNDFQKGAVESRLGIPLIYGVDAVHGNGSVVGATIFPHNIGLGATRDENLVHRIGIATAHEVRASGINCTFAPCVAVCKDPRWGRSYESYSEDTEIVRKMTSIVTGLQGQPPSEYPKDYPFVKGRDNVIACAKHFVGDGGTKGGKNEGNAEISESELTGIHIKPYVDCISKGVSIIMPSYSSWNGRKLHEDYYLLTEILKNKLGFMGFVLSDWKGIDRLKEPRGLDRSCIARAINAGIDMVMVPYEFEEFMNHLTSLVESGEIPEARIDDAVERILRVKFIAGLFEHPFTDASNLLHKVGCKSHRELAREAVRKSLVLLKNEKISDKYFLPLDKKAKKILVGGTHADNLRYQCGGWTVKWQGIPNDTTIEGTTILKAINEAMGENVEVIYEESPSIDTLSQRDISYAIVAVGEESYAETFGDNEEPKICWNGADIVSLVAERIPTLVILISGRPVVLEERLLKNIDGLVAAWLPGSEGGGIADLLFGDYDFQGKLPMTWFKRVDQLPMDANDKNSYDPLFPLGFGLTLGNNLTDGIQAQTLIKSSLSQPNGEFIISLDNNSEFEPDFYHLPLRKKIKIA